MPRYSELAQSLLKEVNDLRRSPQSILPKLQSFLGQYQGLLRYRPDDVPVQTQEGSAAVLQAIEALQEEREPLRTCAWNEALGSAAQAHCSELSNKDLESHTREANRALQSRVESYGKWSGTLVEITDYGSLSAVEVICSLLVDDGMPNREHRLSLLTPDLRFIGIGCSAHKDHRTVTTILMVSKYIANGEFGRCFPSTAVIPANLQAQGWPEGAVKLTCEVATETQGSEVRKRTTKTWAMLDGSTRVSEELTPPSN
jgi:uncharacterized protein YkwD